METLSFWKLIGRLTRWVGWVGRGMRSSWLILRFDFFPTEKNLLISFWIDHAHYRRVVQKSTVYDFLDSRVRYMEERIGNPDGRHSVRRLERSLLRALYREPIRKGVVDFLESPSPQKNYAPLADAIRKAWRTEDEVCSAEVTDDNGAESREGVQAMEPILNARAYIIAVQLRLELRGEESEFGSLSRRLADLRSFIQANFAIGSLPGRLEEFKGYSYKSELDGTNRSKKGQLRVPIRQIMEHPEVFGADVAGRAEELLKKYFK